MVNYESTNGNLTGSGLSGSGNFNVSANGNLNLAYSRINEHLSAYTKNGEIKLAIPSGLDFNFCAKTKNGEIKTNFSKKISGSEHALQGIIGDNPNVLVNLETKNGNMDIEYLNPE